MRMRIDMQMPQAIFAYISGFVHALDPLTGRTIWETKLPKAYRANIGTLLVEGDVVLAGAGGRVYCLDRDSGRILWVNAMPGLGMGMVALATTAGSASPAAQAAQLAADAQA